MDQIIFYGWSFVALVVNVVDGLGDWLKAEGLPPWLIIIGVFTLFGFNAVDKWSIEFARRVEAIEKKLGIEYTPPARKKSAWWPLLALFVGAVYILGKSLQAEGLLPLVGMIISCGVLLICTFGAYCFIDEAARDYWRKKRERQEWIDRVFNKEKDC